MIAARVASEKRPLATGGSGLVVIFWKVRPAGPKTASAAALGTHGAETLYPASAGC